MLVHIKNITQDGEEETKIEESEEEDEIPLVRITHTHTHTCINLFCFHRQADISFENDEVVFLL